MPASRRGLAAVSLPRRDRIAIWTGLLGVAAVSWLYLVRLAASMDSMAPSMADSIGESTAGAMPVDPALLLQIKPWTAADFSLMLLMWAAMMVGMMAPSAIPMTLIYAAIARKAASQGTSLAPSAVFVSGYIFMWTLFSVSATFAQWALEQASLLSPMMVTTSPLLGAALLTAAGVYQLTPAKNACLEHCRAPAQFISNHWRQGTWGAFRMGIHHGAYCLGCCWALMILLFFGGVMNLVWIAGIALFVLLEKVVPFGVLGGRLAGGAMILTGLALLVSL
ncbi:MAG: DUF2182 domain-containing protein [Acidobacteria bacterium]|nr:DUF2182 domain-containing protein [Acidobacteriota bacterium]MCZ6753074.1 DUF2182 domain-containing protein [Acidobacteriota bacterium]